MAAHREYDTAVGLDGNRTLVLQPELFIGGAGEQVAEVVPVAPAVGIKMYSKEASFKTASKKKLERYVASDEWGALMSARKVSSDELLRCIIDALIGEYRVRAKPNGRTDPIQWPETLTEFLRLNIKGFKLLSIEDKVDEPTEPESKKRKVDTKPFAAELASNPEQLPDPVEQANPNGSVEEPVEDPPSKTKRRRKAEAVNLARFEPDVPALNNSNVKAAIGKRSEKEVKDFQNMKNMYREYLREGTKELAQSRFDDLWKTLETWGFKKPLIKKLADDVVANAEAGKAILDDVHEDLDKLASKVAKATMASSASVALDDVLGTPPKKQKVSMDGGRFDGLPNVNSPELRSIKKNEDDVKAYQQAKNNGKSALVVGTPTRLKHADRMYEKCVGLLTKWGLIVSIKKLADDVVTNTYAGKAILNDIQEDLDKLSSKIAKAKDMLARMRSRGAVGPAVRS